MVEVSAIITTKNTRNNIDSILLALFCQSFQDYEIIFVDDNSTDGSLELIENYCLFDDRIKLLKSSSIEDGIKVAKGDYVLLFNTSKKSILAQSFLLRLVDNIKLTYSNFVYTSCSYININTGEVYPIHQINSSLFKPNGIMNYKMIPNNILFNLDFEPWGKLFRKEYIQYSYPDFFIKSNRISYVLTNMYGKFITKEDFIRKNI